MGRRRALGILAALIAASLAAGCGLSTRTPSVALDAEAPDFKLASTSGHDVSLGDLLQNGPTVLVFYRGYW
jgi:hypothetical protein